MRESRLDHLFDADMKVVGMDYEQNAVSPKEGKVGEYMGSGDGVVTGERINGKILWDLYEAMDDKVCLTNFAGRIETIEGATIQFDARGHGMVVDKEKPDDWVMVYGVKFTTDDERFEWLNSTLGVWEGDFSMKTYKHKYSIYAHRNA